MCRLCCTTQLTARMSLSRADLSHDVREGDAEHGDAVQYGNTDLELCDLMVEVASHEALTQQFHSTHLRLHN